MKRAKVVVIDSNNIRVEVQGGSTAGIVVLLSVVVSVLGAVAICQICEKKKRELGDGNVEAIQ